MGSALEWEGRAGRTCRPVAMAHARGAIIPTTPWPSIGIVSGCPAYCSDEHNHHLLPLHVTPPVRGPSP
jgi:hypothetical protein